MSIGQAVSSVLSKYATFSGRARRSEYWWWYVFVAVVGVVAAVIDQVAGLNFADATAGGWVSGIAGLLLFLPTFAVFVRRLHDTGHSGWWLLIGFIPLVGAIVLLIFTLLDSKADNQYGPSPKR